MQRLIFITHRIPYPPNKGDKIRSYHILQKLCSNYKVDLVTFIDDPEDRQHIEHLESICHSVMAVEINPAYRKLLSLTGFLSGKALSLPFYTNKKVSAYVRHLIKEGIKRVVVFSSAVAQFLPDDISNLNCIVDFVDIDSDKWRQYSSSKTWPMSWVYMREYRKLFKWERDLAERVSASLFVSDKEAGQFAEMVPQAAAKIHALDNGVDFQRFSPKISFENPYKNGELPLVFTGAMDYWANVDAVVWFAKEVFPVIKKELPQAVFYIVGSKPTADVTALATPGGVMVTGKVDKVEPYLQHATIAVAPLRIARGIQNKVLEAVAMEKCVVATGAAMEGIREQNIFAKNTIDDPQLMAQRAIELLQSQSERDHWGKKGRELVLKHYDWDKNTQILLEMIEGGNGE